MFSRHPRFWRVRRPYPASRESDQPSEHRPMARRRHARAGRFSWWDRSGSGGPADGAEVTRQVGIEQVRPWHQEVAVEAPAGPPRVPGERVVRLVLEVADHEHLVTTKDL